ncbi:hypothetical protein OG496_47100 [Streptomyces sp. NBC_00988]|uniref:hypothetical protein n=1 Tax=Streptomyces sp. NBC_00988 TaxID=2903704 RepID=UPI00386DD105|nr:hypothetical protein OG496_47100 [Streptomyces sp. NBC_00988]
MADISYTPTFHHVPWEDRKDRVEAAGPNGFNVRFNAIASDLAHLSTVVTGIGTAIDTSNTAPAPQAQRLSFTPTLRPTGLLSGGAWGYDANGVVHANSVAMTGVANLTLPNGLRLTSVRVVGALTRGSSHSVGGSISLARTPLRLVSPPPDPEPLAVNDNIVAVGPLDLQIPVSVPRALIDTSVFRYVLTATFETVLFGGMSIEAVHLTFAPPS